MVPKIINSKILLSTKLDKDYTPDHSSMERTGMGNAASLLFATVYKARTVNEIGMKSEQEFILILKCDFE